MLSRPPEPPALWLRALASKFPDVEQAVLELVAYTIVAAQCRETLEDFGGSLQAMALDAWYEHRDEYAIQIMTLCHVAWSECWRRHKRGEGDIEADIDLHSLFGLATPRPLDIDLPEIRAYLDGQAPQAGRYLSRERVREELGRYRRPRSTPENRP